MYYVVELYEYALPTIVERFDDINDAVTYIEIMSRQKHGEYTIFKEVTPRLE